MARTASRSRFLGRMCDESLSAIAANGSLGALNIRLWQIAPAVRVSGFAHPISSPILWESGFGSDVKRRRPALDSGNAPRQLVDHADLHASGREAAQAGLSKLAEEFTDPLTTLPQVFFRDDYTPANYGTNAQLNRRSSGRLFRGYRGSGEIGLNRDFTESRSRSLTERSIRATRSVHTSQSMWDSAAVT